VIVAFTIDYNPDRYEKIKKEFGEKINLDQKVIYLQDILNNKHTTKKIEEQKQKRCVKKH
jgi:hypothetical protein